MKTRRGHQQQHRSFLRHTPRCLVVPRQRQPKPGLRSSPGRSCVPGQDCRLSPGALLVPLASSSRGCAPTVLLRAQQYPERKVSIVPACCYCTDSPRQLSPSVAASCCPGRTPQLSSPQTPQRHTPAVPSTASPQTRGISLRRYEIKKHRVRL